MRIKLQFGLRWFLLTTTLIAVLIGTVGKRLYLQQIENAALRRRATAVVELEKFEVRVHTREEAIVRLQFPMQVCKPRHFQLAAEIRDLEWLDLDFTGFTDADASTLEFHPNLKRLGVSANPGLTDEGLKSIAKLTSLEHLDLSGTGVSDQGLRVVAGLPKLQTLVLDRTTINSDSLIYLQPLQSLRILHLWSTSVDDAGLEAIGEIRSLESIVLNDTQVRGPGLAALATLPKLRLLNLGACPLEDGSGLAKLKQVSNLGITEGQISPGVLSHVGEMDNLRFLILNGSAVGDEHLLELASATQLTLLALGKTNASEASLRELKVRLPKTEIRGEPQKP